MIATRCFKIQIASWMLLLGWAAASAASAQTLKSASISAMGSIVLPDGSILVIGEPIVGPMSNEEYTMEAGAVPDLLAAACAPSSAPTLQTQWDPIATAGAAEAKSRFIAVKAGDAGQQQTIRVTWESQPNWPGGHTSLMGQSKFMMQPFQVCENSGQSPAISPPDCQSAGQPQRWFWAAELSCSVAVAWFGDMAELASYCTGSGEPCATDADCAQGTCGVDGVIHLFDPGFAPSRSQGGLVQQAAEYVVQVVDETCQLSLDASYSTPLSTRTAGWGDVGGSSPGTCPNPFGVPNDDTALIPDVTEAINRFSNLPCSPKKTRCDMDQDFLINFPTDVLMILNAFSNGGSGFTEPAPAACSVVQD